VLVASNGSEFRSPAATATARALQATLEQNHPNPFNPSTTIAYTIDEPMHVVVGIYDAAGALVARLDRGQQEPGRHEVTWNGVDASGRAVGSGVYFYRLETSNGTSARKMVLLK
jgi:flagellar hook assembly protein FlgD